MRSGDLSADGDDLQVKAKQLADVVGPGACREERAARADGCLVVEEETDEALVFKLDGLEGAGDELDPSAERLRVQRIVKLARIDDGARESKRAPDASAGERWFGHDQRCTI
jgi:hypothetical protein